MHTNRKERIDNGHHRSLDVQRQNHGQKIEGASRRQRRSALRKVRPRMACSRACMHAGERAKVCVCARESVLARACLRAFSLLRCTASWRSTPAAACMLVAIACGRALAHAQTRKLCASACVSASILPHSLPMRNCW
eukprot:6186283-Pleurochrysis_carterae.AAC.2